MATTFIAGRNSRHAEFPVSGQRKTIVGTLTTDGTDGAAAGDIPASIFKLTKVEVCRPLVKSDNTLIVVIAPAADQKSVLGKAAATAGPADIPAGTYNCEVTGY
jgi:hypothetical protein